MPTFFAHYNSTEQFGGLRISLSQGTRGQLCLPTHAWVYKGKEEALEKAKQCAGHVQCHSVTHRGVSDARDSEATTYATL